jgi:hypothetical protein
MSGKKPGAPRGLTPVINHIPPAELKFYTVVEQDLIALAKGSASDIYLSFALALLSAAATLAVTLLSTPIASVKVFVVFFVSALAMAINGLVLLGLWWRNHQSTGSILRRIMQPSPAPPAIQEGTAEPATAG